ncbi:MAG: outer membrane protein assembly factor BamA [Candidatus Pseudothioglobus sp.]
MKNKLIKFTFLLTLFFSIQVSANPINKINFVGLNFNSESTLLKIIPFKIGQNFSSSVSDQIIEVLFKTGYFSDIKIVKGDNDLTITLKENPYVKYFDININTGSGLAAWLKNEKEFLTANALTEYAEENKLSAGNIYTKTKLADFVAFLEVKFLESGYYNVEIDSTLDLDQQNKIGIELDITQGNKATIGSLKISGATQFSEKELLKLFKIGEADMSLINYFTNKDRYSDAELTQGLDLITNTYFDSGYLDFKVVNVETNLSEDKEKIFIDIEISEGIQYKLGQVSFEGELGNFSLEDLNGAINMNKGDVFNRNSIINDIQKLTDMFADQGYAFVDINPITSDFLDSVNVNFNISLNKKVYVNRISISGNTRTQDEVIRREIGVSEGGLYSRSALRDSLLKLRRLGYFSDVQFSTFKVEGMPDKIDLSFIVEETQTGALSFSLSHSNNYGMSVGAGIQEKNIFGSGNTLNADLKISNSFNKLSFYFMNPNFNDEGHSVSIGAFKSEINDDDITENSYEIDTTGLTLGYGIPLAKDTRLNTKLEYSKNKIKCGALFSGSGYELSQCATANKDEFKLNVNWNKSTLNNYLYPTEGSSNDFAVGISLPLGDYRYYNFSGNHSSYTPINENVTLKLTGNFDLGKGYSGKELPFYKRYFGGGSGSVRGFGNKTLGPLYPNGTAKGGELSLLGSANLITPAFFFDNNENMRLSAFIDAGNIYEKSSNLKLGDLRMSAGLGFAYLSPIGSIGFYVATPIMKKSGDTIEDFGFSLGTGF